MARLRKVGFDKLRKTAANLSSGYAIHSFARSMLFCQLHIIPTASNTMNGVRNQSSTLSNGADISALEHNSMYG